MVTVVATKDQNTDLKTEEENGGGGRYFQIYVILRYFSYIIQALPI